MCDSWNNWRIITSCISLYVCQIYCHCLWRKKSFSPKPTGAFLFLSLCSFIINRKFSIFWRYDMLRSLVVVILWDHFNISAFRKQTRIVRLCRLTNYKTILASLNSMIDWVKGCYFMSFSGFSLKAIKLTWNYSTLPSYIHFFLMLVSHTQCIYIFDYI